MTFEPGHESCSACRERVNERMRECESVRAREREKESERGEGLECVMKIKPIPVTNATSGQKTKRR